jgi:hypothetical protein
MTGIKLGRIAKRDNLNDRNKNTIDRKIMINAMKKLVVRFFTKCRPVLRAS